MVEGGEERGGVGESEDGEGDVVGWGVTGEIHAHGSEVSGLGSGEGLVEGVLGERTVEIVILMFVSGAEGGALGYSGNDFAAVGGAWEGDAGAERGGTI